MSFIKMLSDGPDVSLKGSPTVSPTTAALWVSDPLPPWCPDSMYFLALSQAPPALDDASAMTRPETEGPGKDTREGLHAEERADDDGRRDDEDRRLDHFLQRGHGRDRDAARVVGATGAIHEARNGAKLPPYFFDHAERGAADGLHRVRREKEREHAANQEPRENERRQNVEGVHVGTSQERREERERRENRAADGETLADRGRGVAGGVERVRALANFRGEMGHLCDAAGVVGNGPIGVDGKADRDRRDHADGGHRDAVHAGQVERDVDGDRERDYRDERRLVTEREPVDDVRRRTGSGRVRDLADGLVRV